MTYNYEEYWNREGLLPNPIMNRAHHRQLTYLREVLNGIEFTSVLELGAGWGRITKFMKEYDVKKYLAVDISESRLAQIKDVTTLHGDIVTLQLNDTYDLVLAVELLLHIIPDRIGAVIDKMKSLTNKYIVILDYTPTRREVLDDHCFKHDYTKLFGDVTIKQISTDQSIIVWESPNEV